MFDPIQYTEYCTVWIEGYPIISFEINIKRNVVPILLPSVSNFAGM